MIQVPTDAASNWHTINPDLIDQAFGGVMTFGHGYVLVFVDNQSLGKDVWFDNIMIEHYTGKVLEEDHYYPFGLTLKVAESPLHKEQPYKYQGIELEKSFGLETYETFYRGLDPQLGRFNSVDPSAETIYSMSPYVSMGNNPVSNVDYLGDVFTFANSGLQNSYNNLRSDNNSRMAGYTKELGGLDLTTEAGAKRGQELTGLINAHATFNSQLDAMEQSSAEFHISNDKPGGTAEGETFFNFGEKRVQFNMGGDKLWAATLAHELRHGYGMLVGEMSPSNGFGDPLYDMMDEVEGNLTGLLFTSTPNRAVDGSYGLDQFRPGTLEGGKYKQLAGKDIQLSIKTPITIFQKYSNNNLINSYKINSQNINVSVGDALNSINSNTPNGKPRYLWGDNLKK